ncbi:hypothetical protein [Parashewanella curva]|nr:hypothetical protein [Parashewanella curva]
MALNPSIPANDNQPRCFQAELITNTVEVHKMKIFGFDIKRPEYLAEGMCLSVGSIICCFFQPQICTAIAGATGLLACTSFEKSINVPESQIIERHKKVNIE